MSRVDRAVPSEVRSAMNPGANIIAVSILAGCLIIGGSILHAARNSRQEKKDPVKEMEKVSLCSLEIDSPVFNVADGVAVTTLINGGYDAN